MGRSTRVGYTSSALGAVMTTWALVTVEPTSLFLDGGPFGAELPDGPIALPRLRKLLLDKATSLPTKDAVWRELIGRARSQRDTWLVVAVAMAGPALGRVVRELAPYYTGDVADLDSEVVQGFLTSLLTVDVSESALCTRMVKAAHKAGSRLVHAEALFEAGRWSEHESRAPRPPWGHPDFLLLQAVESDVINWADAGLIATTRLEDVPIEAVAAHTGERVNTVVVRRHRAEHRLADGLADGSVAHAIPGQTPVGQRSSRQPSPASSRRRTRSSASSSLSQG